MSDCIIVPVALAILAGECSALLWPPALVGAAWLAVKERRSRRTLLPLAAGCLLCAAVLWGAPKWARRSGLRLRDWVTTCPACLLALLFAVLLLVASWYLIRRADRRWKKWLVRTGALLSLWAVAVWGTMVIGVIARPETVGEWQGQKVVMQKLTWMETTYDYYAYSGPFLLGERLGWSEEPWGENRNRGPLREEAAAPEIILDCCTPAPALDCGYAPDGTPAGEGDVQGTDEHVWKAGERFAPAITGVGFSEEAGCDGLPWTVYHTGWGGGSSSAVCVAAELNAAGGGLGHNWNDGAEGGKQR